MITIQFTYDSLKDKYKNGQKIFNEYIKLLIFDALVGNNDRHFYNWGVIETKNKKKGVEYKFSPIYDTSRGILWNIQELSLNKYIEDSKMESYIKKSQTKTSYYGKKENHFELIENIWKNKEDFEIDNILFTNIINYKKLDIINQMLDNKYKHILSDLRFLLIKKCLKKRFEEILKIITN